MCSFLFTTKEIVDVDYVNEFMKYRGPDGTTIVNDHNCTFLHNLLEITGTKCVQPIKKHNQVLLYNGEIYNYKEMDSLASCDTEVILPMYRKHGLNVSSQFDGEFAFCIIDFNKKIAVLSVDVFATKPLWYSLEKDSLSVASYESALIRLGCSNIVKAEANKIIEIDLETKSIVNLRTIHTFNLTQFKDSYDGWIKAFELSIQKRTQTNKGIFLGVSGGYDSGAILCELCQQDIKVDAYSIINNEDQYIISKRKKLYNKLMTIDFNRVDKTVLEHDMLSKVENFIYKPEYKLYRKSIHDDQSTLGLIEICKRAANSKIYLSGQGADEILSDYGMFGNRIFDHSTINGKFADDLSEIFPWKNFYSGAQECYLSKEDYISGAFGKEGRYPFLDTKLVQEFLWLSPDLKNSHYKAPLFEYFSRFNYPFLANDKKGFNPFKKP